MAELAKVSLASLCVISLYAQAELDESLSTFWGSDDEIAIMEPADLDDFRGGDGTTFINDVDMEAIFTGNTFNSTNSTTGNNQITDSALGNFQGVANVVQNSGNGVLIQTATIVNLKME